MLRNTPIRLFLALVWLINGLYCKVLDGVPRHERIVAAILGEANAPLLTKLIGGAEIMMCLWIISGWKRRWNAVTQMILIVIMNTIELIAARHLLLFGWVNGILALLLVAIIYLSEFLLKDSPTAHAELA